MDGHCWRCGSGWCGPSSKGTGFLCQQCTEQYAEKRSDFGSTRAGALDHADQASQQIVRG